MYLALSYDHWAVDGRETETLLRHVVEAQQRLAAGRAPLVVRVTLSSREWLMVRG